MKASLVTLTYGQSITQELVKFGTKEELRKYIKEKYRDGVGYPFMAFTLKCSCEDFRYMICAGNSDISRPTGKPWQLVFSMKPIVAHSQDWNTIGDKTFFEFFWNALEPIPEPQTILERAKSVLEVKNSREDI